MTEQCREPLSLALFASTVVEHIIAIVSPASHHTDNGRSEYASTDADAGCYTADPTCDTAFFIHHDDRNPVVTAVQAMPPVSS